MTTQKPTENHGNTATVHNPKAPGDVGKVNPQTGDTSTEHTDAKPVKK